MRLTPRHPAVLGKEITEGTIDGARVDGARGGELALPRNFSVDVRSAANRELDQRYSAKSGSSLLLMWLGSEVRDMRLYDAVETPRLDSSPNLARTAIRVDVERNRLAQGRGRHKGAPLTVNS